MKCAIVDYRTSEEEVYNLESLGLKVLLCPPSNKLYKAVNGHPDMQIHILSNNEVIIQREMNKDFINNLKIQNLKVYLSSNNLETTYPKDIILNALNLENLFLHKLKFTDANLINKVKHKRLLNVNQGYTKCSTAVISKTAVMTSDISIAKTLNNEGIDVLLLPPSNIELPGLDYGFIGGTCGLIDEKNIAFFGNIHNYIYKKEVLDFLKKHKINPIYLSNGPLIDRGSLFIV